MNWRINTGTLPNLSASIFSLPYRDAIAIWSSTCITTRKKKSETDAVRQLVERGAEALAGMGGFFSRPYGTWSRFAYDREGMTVIGQRKLKDIFDPKGIMNPGKLCY